MKVIDLKQGTLEWLEWRKGGISASEASVIMDLHVTNPDTCDLPLNPYLTVWMLWAEKLGLKKPSDLSKNPCVQRGKRLEDHARRFFEELFGNGVLMPITAESDERAYIRASFDGLDDDDIPSEIKVLMPSSFKEVLEKGEESEAFKLYYPQIQEQIYVADSKIGRLCFWEPAEDVEDLPINYRVFEIKRDDAFIKDFLAKAEKFHKMVLTQTPPDMDPERDIFVPADTDDAAEWAVIAKHAQNLIQKRLDLKNELKHVEEEIKRSSTHLRSFMGDFRTGKFAGVQVSRTDRKGNIDYKQLLADLLPDLKTEDLEKYRKDGATYWNVTRKDDEPSIKTANFEKVTSPMNPLSDVDKGLGLGFTF